MSTEIQAICSDCGRTMSICELRYLPELEDLICSECLHAKYRQCSDCGLWLVPSLFDKNRERCCYCEQEVRVQRALARRCQSQKKNTASKTN